MNVLFPWFLAGGALIAGPIVAHLIRRATRNRVAFSTLRFLDASPPHLDRRSRIQHPLLLLLRCLVVAALAAAFARPFLHRDLPVVFSAVPPQSVVAILDDSAPMQRSDLWPAAAVAKVNALAASLGPNDQFVLLAAGSSVTELLSRESWSKTPPGARAALVSTILAGHPAAGWEPTHYDTALEAAVAQWENVTDTSDLNARKKIVVISDFTAGARMAGLAGIAWPKDCEVSLDRVDSALPGNASIHWLGWSGDGGPKPAVRVRVAQDAENAIPTLLVGLRDGVTGQPIGEPQKLTVPAAGSQIAVLPVPPADVSHPLRVVVEGDSEPFDDTVWLAHSVAREMPLYYFGSDQAKDVYHPRYYIETAVSGWKDPAVKVQPGDAGADLAAFAGSPPKGGGPAQPSAAIIMVAGPLAPAAVAAIRARLETGACAIVLLSSPAMVDTAAALAGEPGWSAAKTARADAMLGQIDFQHPLFSLFADPRFSNFTQVHFWQPQSVSLPPKTAAAVVARFDDGSPAVLEDKIGLGRMIVWGGDWQPVTSDWVLSTKFVPWFQELGERVAGGAALPASAEVGDTDRLVRPGPARWRPLAGAASWQDTPPAQPGLWEVEQAGATRVVAVQVPSVASDTAPLSVETWEKLGVPLHAPPVTAVAAVKPGSERPDGSAEALEGRQKLWRWLITAAAALLAIGSLFAYLLGRRATTAPA